jgi:hypothetical protein
MSNNSFKLGEIIISILLFLALSCESSGWNSERPAAINCEGFENENPSKDVEIY